MHTLNEIRICNFRSCRQVTLPLADCTPIVGYNNAGKSNLLDAVEWFISGKALKSSDFFDTGIALLVAGCITGLDESHLENLAEKHRTKIEPYITGGRLWLRRIQPFPDAKRSDINLEVLKPSASFDDEDGWKPNPSGIDNALQALFPSPITIGAMEDAVEDATKAKTSSTIGKLLAEFTGPAQQAHGDDLMQVLMPLAEKLTAEGVNRAEELRRFDREASERLRTFFPGISLHLDIPVPTVQELFGKGSIKVSERGRVIRDFTALGHGAQRSIQMALIRYLAEVQVAQTESPQRRLLLIEEPELYLHPQAIEQVRTALENLARSGYQVLYATHSPVMVGREAAPQTRIVRKDPQSGESRIMPTAQEALQDRVDNENKRLHLLYSLENASQWLFSDRVLIAEGPTERYLLPVIYKAITGRNPVDDGLAIFGLGGSGNLADAMTVLNELGIAAKALADFDFVMKEAHKHGLITEDDEHRQECLKQLKEMARVDPAITLGDDGCPRSLSENPAGNKKPAIVFREWAALPAAQAVVDALCQKLRVHGIWLWGNGDIESHLGLTGRKKDITTWASFKERLESESYESVIPDNCAVKKFVDWLVLDVLRE